MKKKQILEAWRNEEFFLSLSEEERAAVPEHPSGLLDIDDDVLKTITGGCGPTTVKFCTTGVCTPCGTIHCY
ncbi:MAG TPA: mersacidin/lichenicidin family type 2 lantibiotic [Thermoanaerobaculia bacterium]|nr:mersacidin/lichenicidin family type 2 lantibiotic [Thermoanaerobaculia bacterium]